MLARPWSCRRSLRLTITDALANQDDQDLPLMVRAESITDKVLDELIMTLTNTHPSERIPLLKAMKGDD